MVEARLHNASLDSRDREQMADLYQLMLAELRDSQARQAQGSVEATEQHQYTLSLLQRLDKCRPSSRAASSDSSGIKLSCSAPCPRNSNWTSVCALGLSFSEI